MKDLEQKKKNLREKIQLEKQRYSEEELLDRSNEALSVVEIIGVFQEAKKIFIYYSMSGELSTLDFIERWKGEKEFYLPVVEGEKLVFRKFESRDKLMESSFGVLEPQGEDFNDFKSVDLIIIPGVAFDRNKNRLGYGKGFYDKFLVKQSAPKMGVCFEFQLFDAIPVGDYDIKMDYVISENDLIW